jgi:hypothetical protein
MFFVVKGKLVLSVDLVITIVFCTEVTLGTAT